MKPFFDYLLGKIRVKDTDSGGSGSGDMTKAVYDPAGINEQLLGIPITVDFLTLAQLGADSKVIEGQVYKYVDAGFLPASIDHILLTGSGTQTYNNIGQAYVTAIGKYVQCDYDLASNDLIGEYVLWCADLSQISPNAPTISKLHKNISGETPTINYDNLGNYSIVFTNDQLVSSNNVDKVSGIIDENGGYFFCYAGDENTFIVNTVKNGSFSDDLLSRTTIKIIVQLK